MAKVDNDAVLSVAGHDPIQLEEGKSAVSNSILSTEFELGVDSNFRVSFPEGWPGTIAQTRTGLHNLLKHKFSTNFQGGCVLSCTCFERNLSRGD